MSTGALRAIALLTSSIVSLAARSGAAADGDAANAATGPKAATETDVAQVQVVGDRLAAPGQTGSSVAVLSRKEVQALPGGDALTLAQITLTQPGFTPDSFGPDGQVHIRGAEKGVLYVVDGVPIPGGLAGQFSDVLPTALIQKLRLISGGQPVEYGPNAGGVIGASLVPHVAGNVFCHATCPSLNNTFPP